MECFDLCRNFPVKVVHFWKWSSLTGWSSPTKTCHSISKKFLFPVLHVLCYAVIKILLETQIDRFDSIGSFVSIQQYVPFSLDNSTSCWLFGLAKWKRTPDKYPFYNKSLCILTLNQLWVKGKKKKAMLRPSSDVVLLPCRTKFRN